MQGERQVPALLKAKVSIEDQVAITKITGMKTGYMILSEFENELGYVTAKIFPKESSAKAYAQDQQVIEVDVIRKFK
jgi:hypothetical protein